MVRAPWAKSVGIDNVLEEWGRSGSIQECFATQRSIGAQAARMSPAPSGLAPELVQALAARGIHDLYSHQAQAVSAALAGRHVVVATPTASGKSYCFHLPVLDALVRNPSATALYLYPTKALSRDQEHNLRAFMGDAGMQTPATVFDGDTPGDARRVAREQARVILTNPDMLHSGILPNHARWASLFRGLRYVVLDELHTYRGIFGSHMAHVVARLRRIANFHGSDPKFIAATATIGNPKEHAARLLGVEPESIELVDESGAPRTAREFFLYNPPIVNEELGIRGSSLHHSVNLAADLVRARVPTIVFGPSRNSVEIMLKYLRDQCRDVPAEAIMAYRGGYLPQARREIERGLREGEILCVVATNALELGIDIGDLQAVVCAGYPGSVAGLWQRFGRAGRRGEKSIAVLVCGSSGLDQYLAQDPEYLLKASAEEARIDPANVEIVISHLKCATFEAPFELTAQGNRPASPVAPSGEHYLSLTTEGTRDALEYLASHGLVHATKDRYFWAGEAFPASHVSLRNIGWDNFVIIDTATDKTLAELDFRAAHTMLHEQAIYQHDAEQYQVERLDFENHKAYVTKVKPDYFTTALTYRTVQVIEESSTSRLGKARIGLGDVKVEEKVTGYKKVKFFTHENAGYGEVFLPEMQMHTTSFWLTVPEALVAGLGHERPDVIDGLRGLGTALETIATLALMCDPRDIGQTLGDGGDEALALRAEHAPLPQSAEVRAPEQALSYSTAPGRNPHTGQTGQHDPTIFLFDAHPGGVGLAPRIYERAVELLGRAKLLIEGCGCQVGCPGCVGPSDMRRTRRSMALRLASALLDPVVVPRPDVAALHMSP
ncbi:MAG: DEAD/DEAH box helicase [Polyangiaceae bacterium]|nr:DEAD/DEAH box helicase [Polyangiaceae bacterium]